MAFREKSAWGMLLVMIITGVFYGWIVLQAPLAPVIGPTVPYVLAVIVLSIIVQVLLVLTKPSEANAPADEREAIAIAVAGHWSGIVLGVAVLLAAGAYIWTGVGNVLFHTVIGGLIVAQALEYAFQIALFRKGV